jgi:hypothetical protein
MIMRQIAVRMNLFLILLLNDSCSPAVELVPRPDRLEILEMINRADLIVVGVVEAEQPVRAARRNETKDSMPLQLMKVNLRVEGFIKGTRSGERLAFFYYRTTGAWDGPAPNLLAPGERDIFYLTSEGDLLRATNDVYSSHTEVGTGRHDVHAEVNDAGVRETIARVLLLPGDGLNINSYVESLYVERAHAIDIVGKSRTADLLRSLLGNSDSRIRGRACILLAEPPLSERGCLENLLHDAQIPAADRERATALSRNRDAR